MTDVATENKITKPVLIEFRDEEDVTQYCAKNGDLKWVIFEGMVYDVTNYLPLHPGGSEQIDPYLGKCIDVPFEEAEHTKTARNSFNDLDRVGIVKKDIKTNGDGGFGWASSMDGRGFESKIQLDYSKGIMWQLWQCDFNLDDYRKFVNEPKHFINPVRDIIMFENFVLEAGSRTPWYVVPIFWLPIVTYFFVTSPLESFLMQAFVFVVGFVLWTLTEYILHRFAFHADDTWLPDNKVAMFTHFMIHASRLS